MTATKTEKLTVEQAVADLTAAREHYDSTVRAVIAGNTKVSPKDVADAKDAVAFAELRLELAHETESSRSEQQRQTRIGDLVQTVKTGAVADKGRQVVALEAQAIAAVEALYLAATDYKQTVRAAANELGRIGELPDNVEVDRLNHQPGSIVIDGVQVEGTYNHGDWPGEVLLGALHRALSPHHASLGEKAKPLANTAAHTVGMHIPGNPGLTAAQHLAAKLDRLAPAAARTSRSSTLEN